MSMFVVWLTMCSPLGGTMHCSAPHRMPIIYYSAEDCEKARKSIESDPYARSFDKPGDKNKYVCKETQVVAE